MRLAKARVTKYRSVRDTGWFTIDLNKTIMVGPNEAGKTAVLQALQQINPPEGIKKFDPLRDYPRSEYNDITTKKVDPAQVVIAEAHFTLEAGDQAALPEPYRKCVYVFKRKLNNEAIHLLENAPPIKRYSDVKADFARLASHADSRVPAPAEGAAAPKKPSEKLEAVVGPLAAYGSLEADLAKKLKGWLNEVLQLVDEGNAKECERHAKLMADCEEYAARDKVLDVLYKRLPVFVLFSNYFRVRPLIHLEHLAQRLDSGVMDDDQYDYGNQCLLKLLGFQARELSNLGKAGEPRANDPTALQNYRDQLDKRSYQLNAASVRLTDEICSVWLPDAKRGEADRLRVVADGQYLKVVVEDSLGVEIELNQRSEGFQWLVSFFVVFFAETAGKHANAILLLDEPGLNLHGLKQRDFRQTISRLAQKNQTLYTTHSPFLVGPDELPIVRVVEMIDRKQGTKVHTDVVSEDPASLLPLQEALGYDLAQSLFSQQRNLILEGLTDYWYVDAVSAMLKESKAPHLSDKVALVPAQSAGKVVYFATILHAHHLKVAALLDSDAAGEQVAKQDVLVHTLGNKAILRTKDVYKGEVPGPEIEDLLRHTLISVAKTEFGVDIAPAVAGQPKRPIVDLFAEKIPEFSKYRLAKGFLRWARDHGAKDLTEDERTQWIELFTKIGKVLG